MTHLFRRSLIFFWLIASSLVAAPVIIGPRCVIPGDSAGKWLKASIQPASGPATEIAPVQIIDRPGNPNVDFMAKNPLGLTFTFEGTGVEVFVKKNGVDMLTDLFKTMP